MLTLSSETWFWMLEGKKKIQPQQQPQLSVEERAVWSVFEGTAYGLLSKPQSPLVSELGLEYPL